MGGIARAPQLAAPRSPYNVTVHQHFGGHVGHQLGITEICRSSGRARLLYAALVAPRAVQPPNGPADSGRLARAHRRLEAALEHRARKRGDADDTHARATVAAQLHADRHAVAREHKQLSRLREDDAHRAVVPDGGQQRERAAEAGEQQARHHRPPVAAVPLVRVQQHAAREQRGGAKGDEAEQRAREAQRERDRHRRRRFALASFARRQRRISRGGVRRRRVLARRRRP
eukprot:7382770-Prymnesium_polylepis.2